MSTNKSAVTRIILRPNRSADWHQTKWFLVLASALILTIAIAWSFVGAWLVLPFAGLEVGLLCFFMYQVSCDTFRQQVIVVDRESVTIQFGHRWIERSWHLDKPQTHIIVTEADHPYDAARLFVADDDKKICIGEFLNQEDIEIARASLKNAGLKICSQQWWRTTA